MNGGIGIILGIRYISHRVLWSGWLKGGPVITDIKPECLLIRGGKDNI